MLAVVVYREVGLLVMLLIYLAVGIGRFLLHMVRAIKESPPGEAMKEASLPESE